MSQPKDNVLHAMVYGIDDGVEGWWRFDAIDHGDTVELVFTWEKKPGQEGLLPGKSLVLRKEYFAAITDPTKNYELVCLGSVNFDSIPFTDSTRPLSAFDNPADLSKPPPDLDT